MSCGKRFWVLVVMQHYLNLYLMSSGACGFALHLTESGFYEHLYSPMQYNTGIRQRMYLKVIGLYSDTDRFVWITR